MAKSSDETKDSEQHDSTLDERRRAHPELGEEKEANRRQDREARRQANVPALGLDPKPMPSAASLATTSIPFKRRPSFASRWLGEGRRGERDSAPAIQV